MHHIVSSSLKQIRGLFLSLLLLLASEPINAQYLTTDGSYFKPFSYEDLARPIIQAQQEYNRTMTAINQLGKYINDVLDLNIDDQLKSELISELKNLDKVGIALENTGQIANAKKSYNTICRNINNSIEKYNGRVAQRTRAADLQRGNAVNSAKSELVFGADPNLSNTNMSSGDSGASLNSSYPIVHISYDSPIKGYSIFIDCYPTDKKELKPGKTAYASWSPADITLRNRRTGKDIVIHDVEILLPEWGDDDHVVKQEERITLHYKPFDAKGPLIPPGNDQIVFFADIDFDGQDEFLVNSYRAGAQWANTYVAYNLYEDKAEMIVYPPFDSFEDYRIEFDVKHRTVKSYYGTGVNLSSELFQFDGSGSAPILIKEQTKPLEE